MRAVGPAGTARPVQDDRWSDLVAGVDRRTRDIVEALRRLDDAGRRGPSALPEWSRLTIACHLRYGAEALLGMTRDGGTGPAATGHPRAAAR